MSDYIHNLQLQLEFIKSCYLVDRYKNQHISTYDILNERENNAFLNVNKLKNHLSQTDIKNNSQLDLLIRLCNSIIYMYENDLIKIISKTLPENKKNEIMKSKFKGIVMFDFRLVSLEDNKIMEELPLYKYEDLKNIQSYNTKLLRQRLDEIIENIVLFDKSLDRDSIDLYLFEDVFYSKNESISPWHDAFDSSLEIPYVENFKYEKADLSLWKKNHRPKHTPSFENLEFKIFKDIKSEQLFLKLHKTYKEDTQYWTANYSFIFYAMKANGFITLSGVDFIKFLLPFEIIIDRIDSRQAGTNKRSNFYEQCKELLE
nr:hypothetical protein [uncultured Psychroserpens sp.]